MEVQALAHECANFVSLHTLEAIVKTESGFDPLKIGVNGGSKLQRQPVNVAEAVVTAEWLLANGYNIDLGLGQVNSANLSRVGLSVSEAFDPCQNLKAAGTIFNKSFQAAMQQYPEGQALQVALSAYNTGNFVQGFRNGYVDKVLRNMPEKASTADNAPATVQPIPLVNAAHKLTIADVIRPKQTTVQPATVAVGKVAETPNETISTMVYQTALIDTKNIKKPNEANPVDPEKPTKQPEQKINVYQESNAQSVMVYSQ